MMMVVDDHNKSILCVCLQDSLLHVVLQEFRMHLLDDMDILLHATECMVGVNNRATVVSDLSCCRLLVSVKESALSDVAIFPY
jgi:hypothetical protein